MKSSNFFDQMYIHWTKILYKWNYTHTAFYNLGSQLHIPTSDFMLACKGKVPARLCRCGKLMDNDNLGVCIITR